MPGSPVSLIDYPSPENVSEGKIPHPPHTIPIHFDFFHQYNVRRKPHPFWPYMKYYRRDLIFYPILLWIALYWFTSNVIPIHQMLGKVKRALLKKRHSAGDQKV